MGRLSSARVIFPFSTILVQNNYIWSRNVQPGTGAVANFVLQKTCFPNNSRNYCGMALAILDAGRMEHRTTFQEQIGANRAPGAP